MSPPLALLTFFFLSSFTFLPGSTNDPLANELSTLNGEDDIVNIRQLLFEVQNKLSILIKRLTHSPSSNPSRACAVHYTPTHQHNAGVTYEELQYHDVRCPEEKMLTRFQLVSVPVGSNGQSEVHFEFVCCSLIS